MNQRDRGDIKFDATNIVNKLIRSKVTQKILFWIQMLFFDVKVLSWDLKRFYEQKTTKSDFIFKGYSYRIFSLN